MAKVLVIIPAYNEEKNIQNVVEDIKANTSYDYIIINDCSTDNTKKVCEENNYNYIDLPINYGLASAIQVGMKYAYKNGYDIAVQFDGDGQHKAQYLPLVVEQIENGYNISIGSRFINSKRDFSIRMVGSKILSVLIKIITLKTINDPTSGMRAYDRRCIEEKATDMNLPPEPDTLVYMMKNGLSIKEVPVEMADRQFGESYLSSFKSIEYMLNMFVSIVFIQIFRKKSRFE